MQKNKLQLGIEFYLFVSHGGMNDRGSMCKFCTKRFSKFTRGSSVFHTSMRNKQVEFNPYIYTLSKLSRFDQEISVFNMQNSRRTASSYLTYEASWKNGCQNFSYVHRSRKHWKCKYIKLKQQSSESKVSRNFLHLQT